MTASAAHRDWRREVTLLRQRDLGLLVASRLVSVTGSAMAPVALAFGVLGMPDGSASALGLVLFAGAVPQVLFMLMGGVLADRGSRARVMVVAESLAGVVHLAAGVLLMTGQATVASIAALAAVGGLSVALFSPAYTGIVPEVVSDEDLQSANALLRLANNAARILGSALAGVLVATVGAGWTLAFDGATFVVSAVLITLVHTTRRAAATSSSGVLADLVHGWHEFSSRRWVVVIVALFSLSNVGFSAAVGVLGPVQATETLGGAGPWAAIVTAFSLGTLVGVTLAMRLRPSRPLAVAAAVAPALAVPVFALAPPLPVAVVVAVAFLSGLAIDVFSVLWDTTLQQHIPSESLSRVSAYDWLGSLALVPLGLAACGPLVAAFGVQTTLIVAAVLCLLPGLALLDPQVRRLRPGRPADR